MDNDIEVNELLESKTFRQKYFPTSWSIAVLHFFLLSLLSAPGAYVLGGMLISATAEFRILVVSI